MIARARLGDAGNGIGSRGCASLLLATDVGEAKGGLAIAAAIAVALTVQEPGRPSGVLLAELGGERGRGPTMLASGACARARAGAARGWIGAGRRTGQALLARASGDRGGARRPAAGARGRARGLGGDRPSARSAVAARPGGAGPRATRRDSFAPIFQATGRWRRWPWPSFASVASRCGSPRGRSAALPRAAPWPAWRPVAPSARRVGRLARGLVGRHRRACRGARPGAADGARRGVRDPVRGLAARGARGRAHRDGPGAARRGPGRALRRTLAARRLPAAVHAAAASRRSAEPASSGPARVPGTSVGGGAPGRRPKRRRSRPAANLVSRRRLLRAASRAGRGHRLGRPGARFRGSLDGRPGAHRLRRRHPDRGQRRGGGVRHQHRRRPAARRDRDRRRLLGTARLPAGQRRCAPMSPWPSTGWPPRRAGRGSRW